MTGAKLINVKDKTIIYKMANTNYEAFLNLANNKHHNKYDYSKTIYINNKTNIIIICPNHGEFSQTPKNHTSGSGCVKCAYDAKNTPSPGNSLDDVEGAHKLLWDESNKSMKLVFPRSNEKFTWKCDYGKDHTYQCSPNNKLKGNVCNICRGRGNPVNKPNKI